MSRSCGQQSIAQCVKYIQIKRHKNRANTSTEQLCLHLYFTKHPNSSTRKASLDESELNLFLGCYDCTPRSISPVFLVLRQGEHRYLAFRLLPLFFVHEGQQRLFHQEFLRCVVVCLLLLAGIDAANSSQTTASIVQATAETDGLALYAPKGITEKVAKAGLCRSGLESVARW
jgi:hypothetical protein